MHRREDSEQTREKRQRVKSPWKDQRDVQEGNLANVCRATQMYMRQAPLTYLDATRIRATSLLILPRIDEAKEMDHKVFHEVEMKHSSRYQSTQSSGPNQSELRQESTNV